MKELVIGADSFIGGKLLALTGAEGTSRGNPIYHHHHFLDMLWPVNLPEADIVYLCAAVNGAHACEGNSLAHRINVDSTVKISKHYVSRGTFVVWISSSTVEWSNSAYARQKAMAESILMNVDGIAIVRAGRVIKTNVDDLCRVLIECGRSKKSGLTLWGEEKPYSKEAA